jgi:hypothetical protein
MFLALFVVGCILFTGFGGVSFDIANSKTLEPIDLGALSGQHAPAYESNPLYFWGTKLMFMGLFFGLIGALGLVLTFHKLNLLDNVTVD